MHFKLPYSAKRNAHTYRIYPKNHILRKRGKNGTPNQIIQKIFLFFSLGQKNSKYRKMNKSWLSMPVDPGAVPTSAPLSEFYWRIEEWKRRHEVEDLLSHVPEKATKIWWLHGKGEAKEMQSIKVGMCTVPRADLWNMLVKVWHAQ